MNNLSAQTFFLKNKTFDHATQVLGFDDCRFTDPFTDDHIQEYKDWLQAGQHGEMKYLEDHLKFKENPALLLKGVRSAIVLIKNYKNTSVRHLSGEFKIARYAVGQDYHLIMKAQLEKLVDFMKKENPAMECICGVDSRPIAERSLALKAGIGFRGKNTMVIKPGLGSYFFIGVILTDHSFDNDSPLHWNCGNCRLCLDACPTGALVPTANMASEIPANSGGTSAPRFYPRLAPSYSLDATKCISYKTIEQKNPLTAAEIKKTDGWIFGCDICQEVCPYNHGCTPLSDWKEFHPQAGVGFDFFERNSQTLHEKDIPKDTPLYRSRKRIVPNWYLAKASFPFKITINNV